MSTGSASPCEKSCSAVTSSGSGGAGRIRGGRRRSASDIGLSASPPACGYFAVEYERLLNDNDSRGGKAAVANRSISTPFASRPRGRGWHVIRSRRWLVGQNFQKNVSKERCFVVSVRFSCQKLPSVDLVEAMACREALFVETLLLHLTARALLNISFHTVIISFKTKIGRVDRRTPFSKYRAAAALVHRFKANRPMHERKCAPANDHVIS